MPVTDREDFTVDKLKSMPHGYPNMTRLRRTLNQAERVGSMNSKVQALARSLNQTIEEMQRRPLTVERRADYETIERLADFT